MGSDEVKSSHDTRAFWDEQAATFDDEADHGLTDPDTRQAWAALLDTFLGTSRGRVVDLGCGTGSVSALLALRGHSVLGVDLSPKMIERAKHKSRRDELDCQFVVGDVLTATVPTTPLAAVISRHLLWAVPDPAVVVARWSAQLADDGVFIAIEGVWNQAGTTPEQAFAALQPHFQQVDYFDLSNESILWGKTVTDHRYAIVGRQYRHRADL